MLKSFAGRHSFSASRYFFGIKYKYVNLAENSLDRIKMKIETIDIALVKENEKNPRYIKDARYKKLIDSIRKFPKMLEIRPIVVNDKMEVLGGNMRLRACRDAGLEKIPIIKAKDLTKAEQKEFIIKDNVPFGEWDWDIIAVDDWDLDQVNDWGLDVPENLDEIKATKDIPDKGEMEFSDELLLEHNYVVLYFDNQLDWEVACDKLGLKKVKTRTPSKSSKIGLGRVINGSDFIKRI